MESRVEPVDIYKMLADKLHQRDIALETARAQHAHIPMKDYREQVTGGIPSPVWLDEVSSIGKDMIDAAIYGQSIPRTLRVEKTLADFGDAELVMEMIRRGYAAMKLPSDGGPPEVLR